MRSSCAGVLLSSLALATGCGAPSTETSRDVGRVAAPLVGGAVDDVNRGVLGLAIDAPGVFAGHCSGTLLAPNLVLTARHCVAPTESTPDDRVTCGVARFAEVAPASDFLASPSTVRPTTRVDPAFFRGAEIRVVDASDDVCGHDVALLVLAGQGIPASLATPLIPRIDAAGAVGESFVAEGYGYTNARTLSGDGTRMRLEGRTVRCLGGDCSTQMDILRSGEWLSVDADLCPGDSGGPALDADGKVFGVASRAGTDCMTGIYSDVAAFRDLVVQAGLDAANAGDYDAPGWTSGKSNVGIACDGNCPDGLSCYSESARPPGKCVPRCASDATCSPGATCSTALGVCVRQDATRGGSSCSAGRRAAGPSTAGEVTLVAFSAFVALRRRRNLTRG